MKASLLTIAILASVFVTACGQNPLQRQSDPLKGKYDSLKSYDVPAGDKQSAIPMVLGYDEIPTDGFKQFFDFKVKVYDPKSVDGTAPTLTEPEEVTRSLSTTEVHGAAAISKCDGKPESVGNGYWTYTCHFNAASLNENEIKPFLKSGKTISAVFQFSVSSNVSGVSSEAPVEGAIPVFFSQLDSGSQAAPADSSNTKADQTNTTNTKTTATVPAKGGQ